MKTPTKKNIPAKSVFITGATSGIGSQIALFYAKEGWNIICHYYSSDAQAKALKKQITKYGVKCLLLKADFVSPGDIQRLIRKLKSLKIDSLVNNAGSYLVSKHFSLLTMADIEKTFRLNSIVPMLITSAVFMRMQANKFGRIVNISSIAAKYGGSSHSMHYGASKLALEGLMKTLARNGAANNILINTVRPGVIDTRFHKRFPKDMAKRIGLIPMKRMGRPEEVAELVYYLGSPRNSFITNEIIAISGGE